jgi:hypothetical protein
MIDIQFRVSQVGGVCGNPNAEPGVWVDTGQRIHKFLRYGEETGCSGTGSADVGLYSLNR